VELTPSFTLFAASNGALVGGDAAGATAAAVSKDQQGSMLHYTSRCGQFSEDGKHLFTVHFVRRGPKNADKRPVLTKWAVNLTSGGEREGEQAQVHVRVVKTVRLGGVSPIMCINLRGAVGVAGDCSGRTIIFQTSNLSWKSRDKMHNFGVTSLSLYPPLPPSFGPSPSVEEEDVRIASTSGDKTLRLQYLHPSHGGMSGCSSSSSSSSRERGWFLSILFFFWCLLLLLLLLGGVFVVLSIVYDLPLERAVGHFFGGLYEVSAWEGLKEVARKGWKESLVKLGVSEQAKMRMEEGMRTRWREGWAVVEAVEGWVKAEVLPAVVPMIVKAKERVDGWRGEL